MKRFPTRSELNTAAADLGGIAANWDAITKLAAEQHSQGFGPGASEPGAQSKNAVSDPTGQRALAEQQLDKQIERLLDTARAVYHFIGVLDGQVDAFTSTHDLELRPPASGAGVCVACERWVAGTADDRLRAGLCPADYKKWSRLGMPDRPRFIRTLRAEIRTGTTIRTGSPHTP